MRSANAIRLVAFIVVAAGTTFTKTTQAAAGGPAASPAAVEFLRGKCSPGVMPKVIATHCYDSLLPQAGTFNGSTIRVIGAATELMVANFRSFLGEIRKLDGTNKDKLGKCADQAAEFAGGEPGKKEPEKLAKIRALAADGDDNKVDTVYDLVSWTDEVDTNFGGCLKEMKEIPDADKLLPTKAVMYPSILVVQGLISGYNPPGAYP